MVATAIKEGQVITYTLTAEELAERDRRFITETIATYMAATNPPPPADQMVKASDAIFMLQTIKKLNRNNLLQYCLDNNIAAKTIGKGTKRVTYVYSSIGIYNHVKNHTNGR